MSGDGLDEEQVDGGDECGLHGTGEARLEHERLDVYRVALELQVATSRLVPRGATRILRDQLDRASIGVVLNIAEGAGRRSAPDKRRFYEMARGSTTEVAAILDLLLARSLAPAPLRRHAKALAVRKTYVPAQPKPAQG